MCHPASPEFHASVNLKLLPIQSKMRISIITYCRMDLAGCSAKYERIGGCRYTPKRRRYVELTDSAQAKAKYVGFIRLRLRSPYELITSDSEGMIQQNINRVF